VRLEGLERRRKNHSVKVTLEQAIKLLAIEHDAGGCCCEDALFQRDRSRHGFRRETFERAQRSTHIAINLAAGAAAKPMSCAFSPRPRFELAGQAFRNEILELTAIHYESGIGGLPAENFLAPFRAQASFLHHLNDLHTSENFSQLDSSTIYS